MPDTTALDHAERECLLQVAEANEVGVCPAFGGNRGLDGAALRLEARGLLDWYACEPPGWRLTPEGAEAAAYLRGGE